MKTNPHRPHLWHAVTEAALSTDGKLLMEAVRKGELEEVKRVVECNPAVLLESDLLGMYAARREVLPHRSRKRGEESERREMCCRGRAAARVHLFGTV